MKRRLNNELVGYIGYTAPEDCTRKETHLLQVYMYTSMPTEIRTEQSALWPADTVTTQHICPQKEE